MWYGHYVLQIIHSFKKLVHAHTRHSKQHVCFISNARTGQINTNMSSLDHCIQTATQESPLSHPDSSQTARQSKVKSPWLANGLSLSSVCLSNGNMCAWGFSAFSLNLAPSALCNLCLSLRGPWRSRLLRRAALRWRVWCSSVLTELE